MIRRISTYFFALSLIIIVSKMFLSLSSVYKRQLFPNDVDLTPPTSQYVSMFKGEYRNIDNGAQNVSKTSRIRLVFSNTNRTFKVYYNYMPTKTYSYVIDGNQVIVTNSNTNMSFTTNGKHLIDNNSNTIFAPAQDFIKREKLL